MSNIIKPFSFKMARGRLLNDLRKDQIISYCSDGLGLRAMSHKIKRSKCVKKFSRQNGNNWVRFSRRARRAIIIMVSNSSKSCLELKMASTYPAKVSKSKVWRVISQTPHIRSAKLNTLANIIVFLKGNNLFENIFYSGPFPIFYQILNKENKWQKLTEQTIADFAQNSK